MMHYFARVPSAAVKCYFDGHLYVWVDVAFKGDRVVSGQPPRMLRFTSECFHKNGEAYVLFAKRGDEVAHKGWLPFGVTAVHKHDEDGQSA